MANVNNEIAFDKVSDVNVVMTVIHPQPIVGLGNMLVLNPLSATTGGTIPTATVPDTDTIFNEKKDGVLLHKVDTGSNAVYREFDSVDAIKTVYGDDDTNVVVKKAIAYFNQANISDRIAVLDYDPAKLRDALGAFWGFNWTWAIIAGNTFDDNTIKISNIFEKNQDHFLVLQDKDSANFDKLGGQNYTIGLVHDLSEAMDSALIGSTANLTVGSTTWKFRQMNGITPELLTNTELKAINRDNCMAYITVNGRGETSEGKALSGEYIDTLHGILWVKVNMQAKIEDLLQTNNKISYDSKGISQLSGVATQVLETAFEQGIILLNELTGKGDYSVTTVPRSAVSQKDLSDRHYGGLSFTYHASGAIHTLTVNGQVQSDTILN